MSKRKTMTHRRDEFFKTLQAMRVAADKAGYLQGCRAAAPTNHDTADVRAREQQANNAAYEAQRTAIRQFNAAVRAAHTGGTPR